MDYRTEPEADEMRAALVAFLRDRLPAVGAEPHRDQRREGWRELVASEWLEHFAAAVDGTPADRVAALHVTEGFGAAPVCGPVDVVAGYLVPLATSLGWNAPLERLRAGHVVTTVVPALRTPAATATPARTAPRLATHAAGGGLRVQGRLPGLVAGADAAWVVVPVREDDRPALALVDLERSGVTVGSPCGADLGRQVADVALDDVAVDAVWTAPGLLEQEQRCAERHSLFLDAEAVGGASEVLARTVRHCREREQFARPVGSFQAIRHRLADAHAAVEGARSLAHRAAWNDAVDAPGTPADLVASRLWAAAAYVGAAEAAIQCHGGMGFTWEQGVHVFYRAALSARARSAEAAARAALVAHLGRTTTTGRSGTTTPTDGVVHPRAGASEAAAPIGGVA